MIGKFGRRTYFLAPRMPATGKAKLALLKNRTVRRKKLLFQKGSKTSAAKARSTLLAPKWRRSARIV